MVLTRNFQPGFKMRLHQKDLHNALNTAKELGLCLPLTGLIQQFLTNLVGKRRGEEDHSALVKIFEELNDVTIKLP
jgi:2-hydroxy-3-oxopropionate reductase